MAPDLHGPFSARDLQRLEGVHPDLVRKLRAIFEQMAAKGMPMFVVMGVRTAAQQHELWRQGRELPGPIVTNLDGIHQKSSHQPHIDSYGHAVDCAFLGPDPFARTHDWSSYGQAGEAEGLVWGGRWTHLVDRPHLELA